jgi:hypothetical protein
MVYTKIGIPLHPRYHEHSNKTQVQMRCTSFTGFLLPYVNRPKVPKYMSKGPFSFKGQQIVICKSWYCDIAESKARSSPEEGPSRPFLGPRATLRNGTAGTTPRERRDNTHKRLDTRGFCQHARHHSMCRAQSAWRFYGLVR